MIRLSLSKNGTVSLRAPKKLRARLKKLKYLRWSRGVAATWWTHLPDIRRDIAERLLKFDSDFAPRLREVMRKVDEAQRGNRQEVLDCFQDGVKPYGFQIAGIHFVLNTKRVLIGDDTGLGKTVQTIGSMLVALKRGEIRRAILIVPAGLKVQWYEEIHRFAHESVVPDSVLVMAGDKQRRNVMYRTDWNVLIVNPELLRRDRDVLRKVTKTVGFVALDEASCIRNPDAEISKTVKTLFAKTRFRLALTATPLENKLADLRSVFEFVDPRCFPSRKYFNVRYVVWKKRTFSVKGRNGRTYRVQKLEPLRYQNLNEVRSKIRPCFIRRRVADVGLELPELIVRWERVQMGPGQRRVYTVIKDKIEGELEGLRGAALIAPLQALRQSCNSTALVEKDSSRPKPLSAKVDRLVELLETDLAGEQVLCFTDYERWARMLGRQLGALTYTGKLTKLEKQRAIAQFRAGDKRILIATKAGERGHNLQCAGVIVNLDLPWNPAALKQRLGRIRRIGSQHQTVRMINLIAAGTVEESLILSKIYSKRKLFEGIFEEDELTSADPVAALDAEQIRRLL